MSLPVTAQKSNPGQSYGIEVGREQYIQAARGKRVSVRGYWFAFAIGVTAGAAVALLYAPQSGVKTRRKLRNRLENAGDYFDDAADYLKERAGKLGNDAQTAVKQGKKQAGAAIDSASDFASTLSKQAKSMV